MEKLEALGVIPVDYSVLRSLFSNYNFPQNKIANLESEGKIIRLKRGMYIVSPKISKKYLSTELIANHIYGPSYVSMETALRYYGLIPEHVHITRSMTFGRSKKYNNSIGNFEYISVNKKYYPIGIKQEIIENDYSFLIATPEKALCDMITSTHGLNIKSKKALKIYLEEDLRIDISSLKVDYTIIEECSKTGKKRKTLEFLLNIL